MAYWLFKSEPNTWSWEDQVKKGAEGEGWDGVRNYQASNNMKAMKRGDLGFFYHSVNEKQIVGIVGDRGISPGPDRREGPVRYGNGRGCETSQEASDLARHQGRASPGRSGFGPPVPSLCRASQRGAVADHHGNGGNVALSVARSGPRHPLPALSAT